MKTLFLAFFFSLQAFVACNALAWSPMETNRSTSEMFFQCQWLTAGSDQNQEEQDQEEQDDNETEEEEEPDCD
jgi:hypothetical protein